MCQRDVHIILFEKKHEEATTSPGKSQVCRGLLSTCMQEANVSVGSGRDKLRSTGSAAKELHQSTSRLLGRPLGEAILWNFRVMTNEEKRLRCKGSPSLQE